MLFTQISYEDAESGVFDGSDFTDFGDFNVLDYAETPQVSPSTIIFEVDSVLDRDHDETIEPKSPEVLDHRNCLPVPRHRRDSHLRAEKKRRNKIQDQLRSLHVAIPTLRPLNSFQKLSEPEIVVEAGKYIRDLHKGQTERRSLLEQLRKEKEKLKHEFDHFQNTLPTTGIKKEKKTLDERYSVYRSEMVTRDWKYSIFGRLVGDSLLKTYGQQTGSESSPSSYIKSLMAWTDSSLCLTSLRPVVISGVRDIATNTSFLQTPERLKQEITQYSLHHLPVSTEVAETTTPGTVIKKECSTEQKERKGRPISATVTSGSGLLGEEVEVPKLQIIKQAELSPKVGPNNRGVIQTEATKSDEDVEILKVENLKQSTSDKKGEMNSETTSVSDIGNFIPILSTVDSLGFMDPNSKVKWDSMMFGNMAASTVVTGCTESSFAENPDTSREKN